MASNSASSMILVTPETSGAMIRKFQLPNGSAVHKTDPFMKIKYVFTCYVMGKNSMMHM
jgi:hypothetical protein